MQIAEVSDDRQLNENDENRAPAAAAGKENETVIKEQKEYQIEQHEPLTTKIYYYVDDQSIPFSTEIPIPPSQITLADFKQSINRRNYRYYCKVMDPALNAEVKTDIRDDYQVLMPNATNGRFELYLLSESQSQSSTSTLPIQQLQHCSIRASLMAKRVSTHYNNYEPKPKFEDESSSPEDSTNLRLFGESNFTGVLSDGDSQYTTTDFTSVSQQNNHQLPPRRTFPAADFHHPYNKGLRPLTTAMIANPQSNSHNNKRYDANNKPCWQREKRKPHRVRNEYSALSSTFEDTEVSMALDLITVTFNLDSRRPFGMSIVTKNNSRLGFAGIYVHDVNPGGLVALDGRIRPGYIILEINDIPLDDYDSKEALNLIISAVRHATETRGQLKLACARAESTEAPHRSLFHPILAEPVRPIDPTAWVQHTNAARGLADFPPTAPTMPEIDRCCQQQMSSHQDQTKMPMPKSATLPKQNVASRGHQLANNLDGIRMVHNPSTDLTTTSAGADSSNASLECSVGQIAPPKNAKSKIGKGHHKKGGGGGIGRALRRLMCLRGTGHRTSPTRKRSNKKKTIDGSGKK